MLWLYPSKSAKPAEAVYLEDTPETWEMLLNEPEVIAEGDEDAKAEASVLCGAQYLDDADDRTKENILEVRCLVLDLDCPGAPGVGAGVVPSLQTVQAALEGPGGLFCVGYTTASHKADEPNLRLLVPLATPLPPKKHRALVQYMSDGLIPGYPGCIDVVATGDPCRLGFVGVTMHEEHYAWFRTDGPVFDWTSLPLEDEEWSNAPLGGLDQGAGWMDAEAAEQLAMKRYASTGYDSVKEGEHRSLILFRVALELWWQWAFDDANRVWRVLQHVNMQFPQAKDDDVVQQKMEEAHGRTVGNRRKPQSSGPYGWRRDPNSTASVASIKHHAKQLRGKRKPELARLGDELGRLMGKDTIADDPGTWRNALGRCAQELAQTYPHERKERLAAFFAPALATMSRTPTASVLPTIEEITDWIGTRLDGDRRRKAERNARLDDEAKRVIEFATGGARSDKYTVEEAETWKAPNGVGLSDKTWILVCGRAYFVFLNGTWAGPYTETEFDAQGYTDLEAAHPLFLRIKTFNEEKGTTAMVPVKLLLQRYGSKCTMKMEYMCERTWYRKEDHTLMLAGPPRTPLEPKFHKEVDEWFRKMAGRPTPANEKVRQVEAGTYSAVDDYDTFCNWSACFMHVDHPCKALYVQGPTNIGKTLLSDGFARLPKNGKIPLTAAMGHFNALLSDTWYIHVDEGLPKGMSVSVLFRRTLSEMEHVVTLKGIDSCKIGGCIRILLTANNLDVFQESKGEKLMAEDVEALKSRFAHIRARPEAVEYLQSISPRHHDFVNKNMIAEHVLWLDEKRWPAIKARDLRFLVEGQNATVSNTIATNGEAASDACTMLAEALVAQSAAPATDPWYLVRDGQLWVNAPFLSKQMSIRNQLLKYKAREIAQAVSSNSDANEKMRVGQKTHWMWRFKLDALQTWCENTRLYKWEDVQAGIEKLSTRDAVTGAGTGKPAPTSIVN